MRRTSSTRSRVESAIRSASSTSVVRMWLANCQLAGGALVVGGRRHAQDPAYGLVPEATAMLLDVAAHFVRCWSSSFAKNTLADFRISFARRSSKFSRLSLRISSRSSSLSTSLRRPSFASTRRTYTLSVSEGTPRSRATCAIGRPDSNTSRVARSNNSSGTSSIVTSQKALLSRGRNHGIKPPPQPAWGVS